jgi:WbqC-like protein family.
MTKSLFSTAYFPCISYISHFIDEPDPEIEICDTYHKQTYRNRCKVMTSNGIQSLSIPVVKTFGNHTMTKYIAISYAESWQQIHRRCLESAYKASPYFDHYFPKIEPLFSRNYYRLIELNDAALEVVLNLLKTQKPIIHTSDFTKESECDFRNAFSPKDDIERQKYTSYYQVFEEKFPFAPDLSILDLLFNLGPESLSYLRKHLKN